jgi:membrane protease subunit HflK
LIPRARGAAVRRLQESEAYSRRVVAEAEGETQRFLKLLAEYERAPGVTRERLYIETIEAVLASSKKVLLDVDGTGNMIYLPLDRLMEQSRRPLRESSDTGMTIESPSTSSAGTPGGDRRIRGSR